MPRHPQAVGTLADLYLDSAGPAGAILSEQDVQQARDYWYDDASNDPGQMPTVMCLFTDSTKRRENSSPQTRDPEPCFFLARGDLVPISRVAQLCAFILAWGDCESAERSAGFLKRAKAAGLLSQRYNPPFSATMLLRGSAADARAHIRPVIRSLLYRA